MLKLPEDWTHELRTLFTQYAPDFDVWAYGSRVTGNHHDASDLDLVLIHPTHPNESRCATLFELREALMQSTLPISVDVMDWARLPAEFHQQISEGKVLLFESSTGLIE